MKKVENLLTVYMTKYTMSLHVSADTFNVSNSLRFIVLHLQINLTVVYDLLAL